MLDLALKVGRFLLYYLNYFSIILISLMPLLAISDIYLIR